MAQKIKRIRLVIDLDANELAAEVYRAGYLQEDDAAPGVRTNGPDKGQLGPVGTSAGGNSADTIDLATLGGATTLTDVVAAIVAAAKTDAGI